MGMRDGARKNDQQGANRGKNRPLNEEINQTCLSVFLGPYWALPDATSGHPFGTAAGQFS